MAQEVSFSMSRCTYHVFLSFRGEDTRTNFTSHLYGALMQAGIHTFLDDDGIERGENIEAELQKAIRESRISIIVFSRDYASSRWCLDELVKIMERRRTGGHTVVPVFYDVDPSQVKKQTDSFGEAFARLAERFKEEMNKVERWRAALREVAELRGEVLGNRDEWQFIQNIVEEIGKKLNRPILNVPIYLVGLDYLIGNINLWVQGGSNDVGIAMIYGIGGIGKTTIAKIVYNMNYDRYEGSSFIGNVRETTNQPNGLVRLQEKLLSDILKRKTNNIQHEDEGIIKIKDAISCRRVLLVLDDVNQLNQLNAMVGIREWFYPGSKIIITTRHKHLEGFNEVCKKFKVKQMDDDESLQLFSWHVFKQDYPIKGYMKWSRTAIHHCGGLPLALKVLGSSLSGKSIDVWESALQKLEAIPDSNIQNVLRISYDSLQDHHDKNLFRNIACFFIGKDKDYTVGILDECGFYTMVGIENLIDRCLLTVNEGEKLMMHQLLRDMGREIICGELGESIYDLGKRSRLWRNEDAFTVLREKTGTTTVKGLTLDMRRLMEDKRGKTIPIVALETKSFEKMPNLELLQLNYVKLKGDYKNFSKNLRWLCCHGFPLKCIPTEFYLEKLVALDMRYSSLKYVWREIKFLAELKFINLSHSHGLLRTPNFSGILSLERLVFKDCINLVKVDESIANLKRLEFLNLKDCIKLEKLPREMSMLESLEELNLSGCSKLYELPDMRKMKSLKVLYLNGTAINQPPSTTRDTYSLKFWLSLRKGPYFPSFSLALLPHILQKLSLVNCNLSYDAISNGFASLTSLKNLNLSGNPFHSLPESINNLTNLRDLKLFSCPRLQSLPEFPLSLRALRLDKCTSLERVPDLQYLADIYHLTFNGCEKLVEVEEIFELNRLKMLT